MNSNADLDRLLRSPVGLAHRCVAGHDFVDRHRYKNRDLIEDLFEVYCLDVWATTEGGQRSRVLTEPRAIDASIRGWAKLLTRSEKNEESEAKAPNTISLKFRVLLTRPPQAGIFPWPKFHDQGPAGFKQVYYLPFFQEDMKDLIMNWRLSKSMLYLRPYSKGGGNYFRETIWNERTGSPEAISLVVNFPYILFPSRLFTSKKLEREARNWEEINLASRDNVWRKLAEEKLRNGDPFIWSICLSYDLSQGTTRALFDGFTERVTEDLRERLSDRNFFWSEHPLYLLMALLDMYVGCNIAYAKDVDSSYHILDSETKLLDIQGVDSFGNNLSKLVILERVLDFDLRLASFLLATLAYLEEDHIMAMYGDGNGEKSFGSLIDDQSNRKPYMKMVNRQMKESLDNTIEVLQNQMDYVNSLQKRNNNTISMLHARLGQINNRFNKERADDSRALAYEAKQDSTSMITISILAIAFLPTTAVAAICSTSLFDWSKPEGVIISPHFWVFWAVVVPLTLLLMASWFAWYYLYRKPKMNDAKEKMECQQCLESRMFKAVEPCEEHRRDFSIWGYWHKHMQFTWWRQLPRRSKKADSQNIYR